jgi:hypothetical protein
MNWLRRLFRKKPTAVEEVLKVMSGFVEVSFIGLQESHLDGEENFMTLIMYFFGGIDYLTQASELDSKISVYILARFLDEEFPGYEKDQITAICHTVVNAVNSGEYRETMIQGAETLKLWITGEVPAPPALLKQLLKS